MNTSQLSTKDNLSNFISAISQLARIQILMVIATQEACVCHIEAALGLRQASISQHLMELRKIGLVSSHRIRRNMYYQLVRPEIIDIITQLSLLAGAELEELRSLGKRPLPNCSCPQCNPGLDPKLTCRKSNSKEPK